MIIQWCHGGFWVAFYSFLTIPSIYLFFFSGYYWILIFIFSQNCYYSKTSIVCYFAFIYLDFYLWLITTLLSVRGSFCCSPCSTLCSTFSVWHFRSGLDVCFSIKRYRNACFPSLRGGWTCHSPMKPFCQTMHEDRPQSAEFAASTTRACKSCGKTAVKVAGICWYIFCSTPGMAFSLGQGKHLSLWRVVFLVGAAPGFQRLSPHLFTCQVIFSSLLRDCLWWFGKAFVEIWRTNFGRSNQAGNKGMLLVV